MDIKQAESILSLSGSYDENSIKKAFRSKSLKVHPDVGGSIEDFQRLTSAKELLLRNLQDISSRINKAEEEAKKTKAQTLEAQLKLIFVLLETNNYASANKMIEKIKDQMNPLQNKMLLNYFLDHLKYRKRKKNNTKIWICFNIAMIITGFFFTKASNEIKFMLILLMAFLTAFFILGGAQIKKPKNPFLP